MAGFTLNTDMLDATVVEVKAIDAKLETAKGTASARKATERAKIAEAHPDMFLMVDTLEMQLAEARQDIEDAVTAALKASKSSSSAEVEALKVQRAELVDSVKAMSTLLKVPVPAIGKAPRSSSGGGSTKSKTGRFYRIVNGERSFYSNDSWSGLAFYGFKRAGVADLDAALIAAGVTALGDAWEVELTVNGITLTVGHEVTEA